jgi:hypothetical protein
VNGSTVGSGVDGLLIVADGRRSGVVGNHGDRVELARQPASRFGVGQERGSRSIVKRRQVGREIYCRLNTAR